MSSELNILNLLPDVKNTSIVRDKLRNSTFIGIDFGTSTTVVSYTIFGNDNTPIKTEVMPIRQLNVDGSCTETHIVPSCIAWYDNRLFIGQAAKQLKSKLTYGRNLWYSFKMKIGTDNGPVYYSTELTKDHPVAEILNPLDATKVFFEFIKEEIDHFIKNNNLPTVLYFSISIPASFEANQRSDLKIALDYAGIPFQDSLFIDEPNAAFLSYLIEANSNTLKNYNIPVDTPIHILVFDFGAGTCDISILEIGRKVDKIYSKNVSISRFEQLGGDDIDKIIVRDILFPQLLIQNILDSEDIKTPEYSKIILPKLQAIAEYLKIKACKNVTRNLVGVQLPFLAESDQYVTLDQSFNIILHKHNLIYDKPKLSFKEFSQIMNKFTDNISNFDFSSDVESVKSIYTVIDSALLKGNIGKDQIDLVLLIGGSSNNPYIQTSLRKSFSQSEIEIPKDLQAHVSTGAAVNSFLRNGLEIDLIKPIVSEPILIILENNITRIIIHEGTEIPRYGICVDGLHPQNDNQKQIEIPICVSSRDKILTIIKIKSDVGFNKSDNIKLECEISCDKLIHFKASIRDQNVEVEPLNPFTNSAMTTEEIAEKNLLKLLNIAALRNNRVPPIKMLKDLANFYVKVEKHLKAAETFESIQSLDPSQRFESSICYHYSCAGRNKQSDKWAFIAYTKDPSATNAYNLALVKESEGDMVMYVKLMEEAIGKKSDAAYLTYGEYLLSRDKDKAHDYIQKAFDMWYLEFKNDSLHKNNYNRLIRASRQLGRLEIMAEVKAAENKFINKDQISWFNSDNLASDSKMYLPEINNC